MWAIAGAAGVGRLSVLVLAWCGLRFGELAGLRVRHFDVLRRELRVETNLSGIGGHLIEGTPKTAASVRRVPVCLVDELAATLGGNWRGCVFDPAVTSAGVARQVSGDMVRPHDLRHTCALLHIK